jgi:hypothetical protein
MLVVIYKMKDFYTIRVVAWGGLFFLTFFIFKLGNYYYNKPFRLVVAFNIKAVSKNLFSIETLKWIF